MASGFIYKKYRRQQCFKKQQFMQLISVPVGGNLCVESPGIKKEVIMSEVGTTLTLTSSDQYSHHFNAARSYTEEKGQKEIHTASLLYTRM